MAVNKVKDFFKKYNMENNIIEFDKSTATVELAAIALNTYTNNIAKSMAFLVKEEPIIVVTSGDSRIDNSKYKKYFESKAVMIKPDELENIIGHAMGGVCPFAINDNVKVYLDVSLKSLDNIYPACGSSNSAIKLTVSELEEYSNFIDWIDVCK